MTHLAKKCPTVICQVIWMIFKRELLNLWYDSDPWSWDLKIVFFQFVSICRDWFYCQGVGSTSENQ